MCSRPSAGGDPGSAEIPFVARGRVYFFIYFSPGRCAQTHTTTHDVTHPDSLGSRRPRRVSTVRAPTPPKTPRPAPPTVYSARARRDATRSSVSRAARARRTSRSLHVRHICRPLAGTRDNDRAQKNDHARARTQRRTALSLRVPTAVGRACASRASAPCPSHAATSASFGPPPVDEPRQHRARLSSIPLARSLTPPARAPDHQTLCP